MATQNQIIKKIDMNEHKQLWKINLNNLTVKKVTVGEFNSNSKFSEGWWKDEDGDFVQMGWNHFSSEDAAWNNLHRVTENEVTKCQREVIRLENLVKESRQALKAAVKNHYILKNVQRNA